MTKVSVVTISYNQSGFLKECLLSVLAQDYPDIEYIVVDPGSTDGSREIISSYSENISKVIFEPDQGPADGLNAGFRCATGDIYYYLNADDRVLPGAISEAVKIFESRPDTDILIGNGYQIDANGKIQRRLRSSTWSLKAYAYAVACAIQQATFFRAAAFSVAGGFNIQNRTCWDGELLVDMVSKGASISKVNCDWGEFRIYPDSISGSGGNRINYMADQRRIRKKYWGASRDHLITYLDYSTGLVFEAEPLACYCHHSGP